MKGRQRKAVREEERSIEQKERNLRSMEGNKWIESDYGIKA
jgi:hypothetical protein